MWETTKCEVSGSLSAIRPESSVNFQWDSCKLEAIESFLDGSLCLDIGLL